MAQIRNRSCKIGIRSGLKLAKLQPNVNSIKTISSMQSGPNRACRSGLDLVTGPDPDLVTLSVLDRASRSLPDVTTQSFSGLAIQPFSVLTRLSVSDLAF